jgi:hypothetical protein
MNRQSVLRILGTVGTPTVLIKDRQSTPDIIRQMMVKHRSCAQQYDKIAYLFAEPDIYNICRRLWNFCKENLQYYEEPVSDQYVSSPGTMLSRGYSDCKGYALIIAGVLDALKRDGYPIVWKFRFASYDLFNSSPGHVFVVVNDAGNEIWVDPVLDSFNEKRGYAYSNDRRPMNANKISGIGCNCPAGVGRRTMRKAIGATGQQVGVTIDKFAPALAAIAPPIGAAVAAVAELTGVFLQIFGSKYTSSSGVRWLTQMYQYYVLRQNVTSPNNVNAAMVIPSQQWFSAVMGVPIYDKYRWHALRGENGDTGASLNQTNDQDARAYLNFPEVIKMGIPYDQALAAVSIAKAMEYKAGDAMGLWANLPVAPLLVDSINAEVAAAAKNAYAQTQATQQAAVLSPNLALTPAIAPVVPLVSGGIPQIAWILIAGGAVVLLLTNKKRKHG